jgi:hypothetical protein
MKPIPGLPSASRSRLTRVACAFALAGLLLMACSLVWPKPLLVILAMSLGHVLGAVALACYILAVLLDVTRSQREAPSSPEASKR